MTTEQEYWSKLTQKKLKELKIPAYLQAYIDEGRVVSNADLLMPEGWKEKERVENLAASTKGKSTANKERSAGARQKREDIARKFPDLISAKISASSAAEHIVRRGGKATRKQVGQIRKELKRKLRIVGKATVPPRF